MPSRTYKNQLVNRRRFKNHEFSRLKFMFPMMIELHHQKKSLLQGNVLLQSKNSL